MRRRSGIGGSFAGALVVLVFGWSLPIGAEALPKPAGLTILVVDGRISTTNQNGAAAFDLALLKSLPMVTLKTTTPWTEGENEFEGVRMRDLLDRLGGQGTQVTAAAIDEYQTDIPIADFRDYDVVLAYAMNGTPLPPDDKGPLWIVYPFSANPVLQKDLFFARCVWQVSRMTVR
jgi:hypothetical protein